MERQLPKNVRQIGNVSDSSKIYVEDYVDTFFNQLCEKAEAGMQGAFLVGETVHEDDQDYIYVYGAIGMQQLEMKGKDFVINDEVWKTACETCKEFFGDAAILGWFVTGEDMPKEITHNIKKIHQKYFPREKSVFVTKSVRDKEEKFYIYKFREMLECGGHYIYYEKNVEMQNYMIASRKKNGLTPSEIIEDRVTKNFRSMIQEKMDKNEQKSHSRLVYAMSTFLVLVILIIGVTMINNYDRIKNVQNSLNEISNNVFQDREDEDDESVAVSGDVVNSDVSNKEDEQESDTQEPVGQEPELQEPELQEPETQEPETQEPEAENPGAEEPGAETPTGEVYIVQKGDTLETISRQVYGDIAHIRQICEINGLEDGNLIFIGQKLLLP